MKKQLEEAVRVNAEKAASKSCTSDDALKYSQAAVNAANAMRSAGIIK